MKIDVKFSDTSMNINSSFSEMQAYQISFQDVSNYRVLAKEESEGNIILYGESEFQVNT